MSDPKALRSYRDGYDAGAHQAEIMISNQVATGGAELELRAEARVAVATAHTLSGRREAAWRLGLIRGFREVAR